MQIVALNIDNTVVYVEIEEKVTPEGRLEGAKKKLKGAAKTVDDIGEPILAVCRSMHQKAYKGMGDEIKPAQFEVEFGLSLGGEMGVPFIAKAQGEAQFKIRATWHS